MTDFGPELLATLREVDGKMQRTGAPPIHPKWWAVLESFYTSGRRQLVIRKSRRIGASSIVAARLIVASYLVLRRRLRVPAGETATLACVSVKRSEASARLKNTAACLSALGIPHEPKGDAIELDGTFEVKVLTASARSEVGQLLCFLWADEVSRWLDSDTGSNPASEVLAALKPSLATVADARVFLCSTPLTLDDHHAAQYALGETEGQCTAFLAPSWEVNPQLSEADCRRLEPNEARFQREYYGIPGAALSPALDASDIAACTELRLEGIQSRPWLSIDPSALLHDGFGWMVGYLTPEGVVVDWCDEYSGAELGVLALPSIAERLGDIAVRRGINLAFTDQGQILGVRTEFPKHGLHVVDFTWTERSKEVAFELIGAWLRERRVSLPAHEGLLRELRSVRAHLKPGGSVSFDTNGRDLLSCLVTFAHACAAGLIPQLGAAHPYAPRAPRQQPRTLAAMGQGGFGPARSPIRNQRSSFQSVIETPPELRGLPPDIAPSTQDAAASRRFLCNQNDECSR